MSDRHIRVQGHAEVSAPADQVQITFEINAKHHSYAEAAHVLAKRTTKLRAELTEAGVSPDALKTSSIAINPWRERIKDQWVNQGFQAGHHLILEIAYDHGRLDEVLTRLGATESQAEFQVRFTVKDIEPMRQEALARAVKTAQARAEAMAAAAGATLGPLVGIEYGWNELRIHSETEFAVRECSMAEFSLAARPKDVVFQDSVTVTWEIKE